MKKHVRNSGVGTILFGTASVWIAEMYMNSGMFFGRRRGLGWNPIISPALYDIKDAIKVMEMITTLQSKR